MKSFFLLPVVICACSFSYAFDFQEVKEIVDIAEEGCHLWEQYVQDGSSDEIDDVCSDPRDSGESIDSSVE